MIVKAKVITNSSQDPEGKGRVLIESPTLWESQSETENYVPVLNNIPLNVDDIVFVYLENFDISNPLILGKCRDNNFVTLGDIPENFQVLWESVSEPDGEDKTWSVLYVSGKVIQYQNSDNVFLTFNGADFSYSDDKSFISKNPDGDIEVTTEGTITIEGEGESNQESSIMGDTLKSELQKISKRLDAVVDNIGNMINSGVPAPMDGGAALKSTMSAFWQGQASTMKSGNPNETWEKILNTSIKIAGKVE